MYKIWDSENTMWAILAIAVVAVFGLLFGGIALCVRVDNQSITDCVSHSVGSADAVRACKEG